MDYGRTFDEGSAAHTAGHTATACPYETEGSCRSAWLSGFAFAEDVAHRHWEERGKAAYAKGEGLDACPHPNDPICASAWENGWRGAKQDQTKAEALPQRVKTIDATPTWRGLMPALLHVIEHGPDSARDAAAAELHRLAAIVDEINASTKNKRKT